MINSQQVKASALGLGARLCGIAPVERFGKAPAGFHPADIFPASKSVVVLAKLFPEGSIEAAGPVSYSGHLTPKGYYLDACNECRKVCPNGAGIRNREGWPLWGYGF